MTYRAYVSKRFGEDALARIGQANSIIEEYSSKGYSLTLRQLYYQHVARGLIANNLSEYSKLGSLINDGRLAGLISWDAIEDRERALMGLNTYRDPAQLLKSVQGSYRIDLWEDQPWRPEVWVEKKALVDVIGDICNRLRVDFFACKGYVSQSEMYTAGRRMFGYITKGQRPIVFHLGDHDPSGIDMTRDNEDRLTMFAGTPVTVVRLALNMDQVDKFKPPPNPAKVTDSRFEGYRKKFGDESWELDALNPETIHDLIHSNVLRIRDGAKWDDALAREVADKQALKDMIDELGTGEEGRDGY